VKASGRPYAEALFGIASARAQAPAVLAELTAVDGALPARARQLLTHPGIEPGAPAQILGVLARACSPLVGNFLRLLAEKHRFPLLPEIIRAFGARLDEAEGRVRAQLQTARPVEPAQAAALALTLGRRLARRVELTAEVRPDLIGGARVLVGDRVLDGSLLGQLAGLRRALAVRGR